MDVGDAAVESSVLLLYGDVHIHQCSTPILRGGGKRKEVRRRNTRTRNSAGFRVCLVLRTRADTGPDSFVFPYWNLHCDGWLADRLLNATPLVEAVRGEMVSEVLDTLKLEASTLPDMLRACDVIGLLRMKRHALGNDVQSHGTTTRPHVRCQTQTSNVHLLSYVTAVTHDMLDIALNKTAMYTRTGIHVYIHIHAEIHTFIHTCTLCPAYIHTYMHKYMHAYIHAYTLPSVLHGVLSNALHKTARPCIEASMNARARISHCLTLLHNVRQSDDKRMHRKCAMSVTRGRLGIALH